MASNARWPILHAKKRNVDELDLTLHADGLMDLCKLAFIFEKACDFWCGYTMADLQSFCTSNHSSHKLDIWLRYQPELQDEEYTAHAYGSLGWNYGTGATVAEIPSQGEIYQGLTENVTVFQDQPNNKMVFVFTEYSSSISSSNAGLLGVYTDRTLEMNYSCSSHRVTSNGNGSSDGNITVQDIGPLSVTSFVSNGTTFFTDWPNHCPGIPRCAVVQAFEASDTDPWYYTCNITVGPTINDHRNVSFVSDKMAYIAARAIANTGYYIGYSPYNYQQTSSYPQKTVWGIPVNGNTSGIGTQIVAFGLSSISGAAAFNPLTFYSGTEAHTGLTLSVNHTYLFSLIVFLIPAVQFFMCFGIAVWANRVVVQDDTYIGMSLLLRPIADALYEVSEGRDNKALRDEKRRIMVSCSPVVMVPPSSASAKSIIPEPRPPTSAELDVSEPRKPWYRVFLSSKEILPQKPEIITPDSSADLTSTPTTTKKKVGWSEKYDYKDPPKIITDKKILFTQALSPLTPSAERKATKSISEATPCAWLYTPHRPFRRMLESISKQLAGQDRSSRLDAYMTLSGALKACDNVPDRKALSDKMDLILQFIKRDINAKHESGALDIQLTKEALVLTSSFLHKKSISDMLTPDFSCLFSGLCLEEIRKSWIDKGDRKALDVHYCTAKILSKNNDCRESNEAVIQISGVPPLRFGEEAGLDLGTESKVSSKLMEIFKGVDGRDVKYGDFCAERLRKMVARKPPGPAPRIWAVVILFLRARPQQVEHWAFIKPWLDVIKPNATSAQLDVFWDSYIFELIGKSLTPTDYTENLASAEQDLSDACNILRGLFDSRTQRFWTSTRAMNDNHLTATELPGLDPRWLRKSAPRVFKVLSPIMELLYWEFAFPKSKISLLWENYTTSISSAAAKEVKTSNDTMACLAFLFGTLYRIWQKGPDGLHSPTPHRKDEANFFASFKVLVTTVISGLGVLPFTERLLSMGQQDSFIVVATPSHRPGKIKGEVRSPLHHLFLLLASPSPGSKYDLKFSEMAEAILTPFFEARRLSKGKMDLVKDLLEILPSDNIDFCGALWTILAKFATAAINFRDETVVTSSIHDTRPLGSEYRSVARILEVGIGLSPREPLEGWKDLFQALVISSTTYSGHGGRAIVVVEPISKALTSKWQPNNECCDNKAEYCQILVAQASYPKDRQALDAARKRLWGSATAGPKIHMFDSHESSICNLLGELEALLVRCPKALFAEAVVHLQDGIVCWIRDEEVKLHGASSLSGTVTSLWGKICSLLVSTTNDIPKFLNDLEPLLCSGLGSKCVSIANMTIEMWNVIFGSFKGDIQYPPQIKEVLSKLVPMADLPLSLLPESSEDQTPENHRQPLVFFDTQIDSIISSVNLPKSSKKASTSRTIQSSKQKLLGSSPQVVINVRNMELQKRSRETTPEPGKRKSRKKNSVAKLRHDNSQIQFEAIAGSSPLSEATYDSQLLTERQKEVRERQVEVAAMFPDIRSSPRLSSRPTPKNIDNEIELPPHLSSSKLCLDTLANSKRQSTPDTQVIENQDTFLASSPTPARSLLATKSISHQPSLLAVAVDSQSLPPICKAKDMEMPSSPPQAETRIDVPQNDQFEQSPLPPDSSIYQSTLPPTSSDEFNVTSFPTNFSDATNEDATSEDATSEDATSEDSTNEDAIINNLPETSAQIDLYDFDPGQTMSTYKSTPSYSGKGENLDLTIKLTSSEEQARDVSLQNIAIEHRASDLQEDQIIETTENLEVINDLVFPSTPRSQGRAARTQLAPNAPKDILLNAKISGIPSDGILDESEIFEDALTSPRALPPQIQESSEAVPVLDNTSSPLSDFDESSFMRLAKSVDRTARYQSLNITIAETPRIIQGSERRSPVRPVSQSSACQFLIPETPALQLTRKSDNDNIATEPTTDDSDADSIIIVTPRVACQVSPNTKSKSRKPRRQITPVKFKIENEDGDNTLAKKRKFDSAFEAGSEVPDSQEALRDVKSAPPSKMRRLQSVKTPEPAMIENVSPPRSAQSQQPTQFHQSQRATRRSTRSSQAKINLKNTSSMSGSRNLSSAPGGVEANSSIVAIDLPTAKTPSNEALDETTLGETELGEQSSSPLDQSELDIMEETLLQSQIAEDMEIRSQQFTSDQQGEVEEPAEAAPTSQSIKEKLLSLIKDLKTAALSRREVDEIEDVFMDAKSKLYEAGKRGKRLADD
ncbi:hypothetical protein DID88_004372 [Monilinia fructigena]|uniref:Telomere-associated protein Rif1 N-terminal domain-containing protein n=1 Tax=Monilinia fructigena TaxID=38457 RepID=A0A395ITA4_9HELO|nr:hypothetical protein DID88_004372 [Monilinia fructigena]